MSRDMEVSQIPSRLPHRIDFSHRSVYQFGPMEQYLQYIEFRAVREENG